MKHNYKAVAFSGHRSEQLPKNVSERLELEQRIRDEIERAIQDGYDTFIMGACYGFDLMCARQVLMRRRIIKPDDPKKIRLIAAVPYEEQAIKWKDEDRETYYSTLAECDEAVTLNTHYKQGCFYERNRWMVDRSSRLICYCKSSKGGTAYTVAYAEKNGVEVINLFK